MQYCFILTGLDFDDISWIDKAGTILRRNLKFNIGPYRLPSDNVESQTLIIIITVYLMKKKKSNKLLQTKFSLFLYRKVWTIVNLLTSTMLY